MGPEPHFPTVPVKPAWKSILAQQSLKLKKGTIYEILFSDYSKMLLVGEDGDCSIHSADTPERVVVGYREFVE